MNLSHASSSRYLFWFYQSNRIPWEQCQNIYWQWWFPSLRFIQISNYPL